MGRNRNKTWECPYFVWDDRLVVHCEAGRIQFPDVKNAEEFIDRFCARERGWKYCTLARNLDLYYEKTL